MFGSVKKRVDNPHNDIETIIGRDTVITGSLESSNNIRIDGKVEGNVTASSGDVIIGDSGSVNGDIKASNLTVAGSVTGNVDCDGNLGILASGQLVGDVRVRSLNIADGGIFRGRSEMETHAGGNFHSTSPVTSAT